MSLIGTRSIKLNESGQGVIEYILVLTITVLLIGTFIYQFSSAFRKYANNYFGDYIMCLLETGELPGQAGECKELFSAFDINAGKTSTGGNFNNSTGGIGAGQGGSNSGSGGTGSNSSSSKNAKNSRSSKNSSSDSGGTSTASTGGSEVGVSGGDSSGGLSGKRRTSTPVKSTSGDGAGAGGKGREALKPVAQSSGGDSSSSADGGRGRKKVLERGFGFAGQDEQKEREEERPATKAVAKDEGEGLRPKKVAVDTSRKPAAVASNDSGSFTLGGFLRILLIAGILIAIFVVFGSQILAISKGGEK